MGKTEQLQIRVSAAEKARIRALARRAGEDVSKWVLRRLLPPARDGFQERVASIARSAHRSAELAHLADFLTSLSKTALVQAVVDAPLVRLDAFEANYVAAMVETACAHLGVVPPDWVRAVVPLTEPWFASDLHGLRLHLLASSPPPFRRRNLFVDSSLGDRV